MSEITIKSPKTGTAPGQEGNVPREVTISYDFGADLDATVEMFGAPVVHSKFVSQGETDLGNAIRGILNRPEKSAEDCVAFAAAWKPGVVTRGTRKAKEKSVEELMAELRNPDTAEERKAELKETLTAIVMQHKKDLALLKGAV